MQTALWRPAHAAALEHPLRADYETCSSFLAPDLSRCAVRERHGEASGEGLSGHRRAVGISCATRSAAGKSCEVFDLAVAVAVAGASSIVMPRSWNAYLRKVQVSRLCLQDNARYCILRLARKYMQLVVAHSCVDASHSAVRKASSVQSLDAVRHLQKSMAVPAPQASRAPEIQRPKESRRGSGDGLRGPKGKGV